MSRNAGRSGAYLISWTQTQIDGHSGVPESALRIGSYWRWSGDAVNLGAAIEVSAPVGPMPSEERRRQFETAARRVVGQALGLDGFAESRLSRDRTITLSDGTCRWVATLMHLPDLAHPLVMFADKVPPADLPLCIEWVETRDEPLLLTESAGVICFTPGTWIETPGGARQIEHLAAGDKVMTVDGGAQELVWSGTRRLSLRDLRRTPDLAPVRIREGALEHVRADGDLVVSPDHRMLVRRHDGAGDDAEILVTARDLLDGKGIVRELPVRPVTYVHLLFERHHILLANGFETESFHPGAASLDSVPQTERQRLFDVMPMLRIDPQIYGPSARPVLSRAEVALLAAA